MEKTKSRHRRRIVGVAVKKHTIYTFRKLTEKKIHFAITSVKNLPQSEIAEYLSFVLT